MTHRIDTHHHVVPPSYAAMLADRGIDAGGRAIPDWTPEAALALMEQLGVATSILSVSTPGVHLGNDAEARRWAREVNEYSAEVVRDQPSRFGFFATLTLPDVAGALEEAAYALDELDADGVILLANVEGRYLGDPDFDELLAELNERRAVVFVHPSHLAEGGAPNIPAFALDFLLDTSRTALSLCMSGAMERYRDMKVILSHAGGFIPYAAYRVSRLASPNGDEEGLVNLRRFYFDTALSGSPPALAALLQFAAPGHVTFGSDWPYAAADRTAWMTSMYEAAELEHSTRDSIDRGAAQSLFPRLAGQ